MPPGSGPGALQPTILVRTADKIAGKRTKKLLVKCEDYKGLNTGFAIEVDKSTVEFRGGPPPLPSPATASTQDSVCLHGAAVLLHTLPITSTAPWKTATICTQVLIDGVVYAVMPAHVFYDTVDYELEEEGPEDCSDDDSFSDNGSSLDSPSTTVSVLGLSGPNEQSTSRQMRVQELTPHAVYLDHGTKQHDNFDRPRERTMAQPSPSDIVGTFRPISATRDGLEYFPHFSPEFDWALIEIERPAESLLNGPTHPDDSKAISRFARFSNRVRKPCYVAGGVSGIKKCKILSASCSIMPPWSTQLIKVRELNMLIGMLPNLYGIGKY